MPAGSCAACHADPHNGSLGAGCADCHTTRGFGLVDKERFAHDRTRYPLRGKHAAAKCADCHGDFATAALKKPAFAACASCHADAHRGTATLAGRPADCAACHTVGGFTPATYTAADHARSAYPLEGKHGGVKCAACHARGTAVPVAAWGSARVVLRPKAAGCLDCHADPHAGAFAARPAKGGCEACHTVEAFAPAPGFDHDRDAAFRLEGAHATAPCRACHAAGADGPVYRPLSPKCESCHGKEPG